MSSRALRKAQKEREEQTALEAAEGNEAEGGSHSTRRPQKSLFSMLNEAEFEDDEDDEGEEQEPSETGADVAREGSQSENVTPTTTKRKKKKKKAKKSSKAADGEHASDPPMDEIDAALQALSTKSNNAKPDEAATALLDTEAENLRKLIAVDTSHLHASNEMRRLFGRTAFEDDDGGGGRRNRDQQRFASAMRGRGGGSLADLARKRNIFVQGRENWPSAPSGGLGMEVVEKRPDGIVEYAFVHNGAYRDSQRQFEACVASMDPERMIQHLHFNPYHISTLLQVSEIAKYQGDHAVAGELLERALFSFGRAVHSTFASNISSGKARLSFDRAENREFWLAVWRFIGNLSMRSLFRTCYEWLKLLLSLDPFNDPYRICLVIDQYAIRAKQAEHFLDLYKAMDKPWVWGKLPNIQLTRGLAINHAKTANDGKQQVYQSAAGRPWIIARLFQELEIDPIPPGIWGSMPRTDREILEMEMYVKRAKNIWNTPEAKELLIEVVSAIPTGIKPCDPDDSPITIDEARHVLLTEDPEFIKHLPREMISKVASASDPLPPEADVLLENHD